MQQKRALVTGAARRLGRAMALCLAGRGYDVAVHYSSSQDEAGDVVREISKIGRKAVAIQADLQVEEQVQSLIDQASKALGGPLSVLVNNASVFEHDDITTADRQSWDRHIEANLRAPFVLTQNFAANAPQPVLDENAEPEAQALVVNLLDQRIHKLTPEFMSYTISKMGLWAFTQTAAMALGPKVRVNAIGPGPTLKGARQTEDHFAHQRASTLLGRGANPKEINAALNYLLDASSVTGQMIVVDGGQHLAWKTPEGMRLD